MNNTTETTKKSRPIFCVVQSDKMDKSRVGVIEKNVKHSVYGKYQKRITKLMFHDENNETRVGDQVLIVPGRPLSKRKNYKLLRVVTSNRLSDSAKTEG